jgi:hypothetical protein
VVFPDFDGMAAKTVRITHRPSGQLDVVVDGDAKRG